MRRESGRQGGSPAASACSLLAGGGLGYLKLRFRVVGPLFVLCVALSGVLAAKSDSEASAATYLFRLDDIIVNLSCGDQDRYLTLNVAVELECASSMERLRLSEASLRQEIASLIRRCSAGQADGYPPREILRSKIRQLLRAVLSERDPLRIFFVSYIPA